MIVKNNLDFSRMYLKPEWQEVADDFAVNYSDACCSCHINPPCSWCIHEGNPMNLAESDAYVDVLTAAVMYMNEIKL